MSACCPGCGTQAAPHDAPPAWDKPWWCWACLKAKVAAARGGQRGEAR